MASSTTGRVEVLVARIVSGLQTRSSSVKRCFFTARSSTTDSMTRSTSTSSPRWVVALTRPGISAASASVRLPFSTCLASDFSVRPPWRRRRLAAAAQHHLVPVGRRHLGDARAHDPRTDDSHPFDRHGAASLLGGNHGRRCRRRVARPGVQEWRHGHDRHAGPRRRRRMDRGLHLRQLPPGRLRWLRRAGAPDRGGLPAPGAGRAAGGRVVRSARGPGRGTHGGGPAVRQGSGHGCHRGQGPFHLPGRRIAAPPPGRPEEVGRLRRRCARPF